MTATILLLDDDRELRALMEPALRGKGHQVTGLNRIEEALALVERDPPDLVIVDETLPDGGGVAFIEQAREHGVQSHIVYVTATWWDQSTFERLTGELQVARVLFRPLTPDELVGQVDLVLRQPPTRRFSRDRLEASGAEAMRHELDRLKDQYASLLPEKLDELEAAILGVRSGDPPGRAIVLAHRLHGTAGSYGFERVSEAARTIEDLLRGVAGGALHLDAAALERLRAALARARQAGVFLVSPGPPPAPDQGTGVTEAATTHLLLVTDDEQVLDAAGQLPAMGLVRLLHAPDRDTALGLARREVVDCAILATRIGGESGTELALTLRDLQGLGELPIAFLATDNTHEERVAAIHAGGSIILNHPVTAGELGDTARHLAAAQEETRPRLLLLDDDEEFARPLCLLLRRERFVVQHLQDPGKVLERLESFQPDVLLLDMVMPLISGMDVCKLIRSTPRWQDLPVLLLTSQTDTRLRVEAFRAGADDYLLKPVVPEELLARLRLRLDRARLYRERSSRDPLTGLLTRRAFLEMLGARLVAARRTGDPLSLCLLDVDGFKRVNDTHGHMTGDRVLIRLGELLGRSFRVEDLRGRWGGEEFTLAFLGLEATGAAAIVTRALTKFHAQEFTSATGEPFHVTFSGGVSTFPADGETPEDLLRVADVKLYRAKYEGGDRITP
jgi:diguanylate cyclase (GGDEF)-like protein